jgi:hypothetical protein
LQILFQKIIHILTSKDSKLYLSKIQCCNILITIFKRKESGINEKEYETLITVLKYACKDRVKTVQVAANETLSILLCLQKEKKGNLKSQEFSPGGSRLNKLNLLRNLSKMKKERNQNDRNDKDIKDDIYKYGISSMMKTNSFIVNREANDSCFLKKADIKSSPENYFNSNTNPRFQSTKNFITSMKNTFNDEKIDNNNLNCNNIRVLYRDKNTNIVRKYSSKQSIKLEEDKERKRSSISLRKEENPGIKIEEPNEKVEKDCYIEEDSLRSLDQQEEPFQEKSYKESEKIISRDEVEGKYNEDNVENNERNREGDIAGNNNELEIVEDPKEEQYPKEEENHTIENEKVDKSNNDNNNFYEEDIYGTNLNPEEDVPQDKLEYNNDKIYDEEDHSSKKIIPTPLFCEEEILGTNLEIGEEQANTEGENDKLIQQKRKHKKEKQLKAKQGSKNHGIIEEKKIFQIDEKDTPNNVLEETIDINAKNIKDDQIIIDKTGLLGENNLENKFIEKPFELEEINLKRKFSKRMSNKFYNVAQVTESQFTIISSSKLDKNRIAQEIIKILDQNVKKDLNKILTKLQKAEEKIMKLNNIITNFHNESKNQLKTKRNGNESIENISMTTELNLIKDLNVSQLKNSALIVSEDTLKTTSNYFHLTEPNKENQIIPKANQQLESLNNQVNPFIQAWVQINKEIENSNINSAYGIALELGDDLLILRLMLITGPCLDILDNITIRKLLIRLNTICRCQIIQHSVYELINQSYQLSVFQEFTFSEKNEIMETLYEFFAGDENNKKNNSLCILSKELYTKIQLFS